MKQYLDILEKVLNEGVEKQDRTGTGTIAYHGCFFEHNMSEGFPLLTTKRVPFKLVAQELEFFIKGITDKEWLRSKNNHIWDEWCSPDKVPYSHDPEIQKKMKEERCLGPLYGFGWRNFGGSYKPIPCIHTNLDKSIKIGDKSDDLVGKVINGKYGKYTIIEYDGKDLHYNKRYTVKFHKTGYIKSGLFRLSIENGNIFDPYFPSVQGVACLGDYKVNQNDLTDHQVELLKNTWKSMIHRCYNPNNQSYDKYGAVGIYVEDEWLIFENYLRDIQIIDNWDKKLDNWDDYNLDKDILGNFEYSKNNCMWVTKSDNNNHTSQNYYFNAISPEGKAYINEIGITRFCDKHGLKIKTVLASIKNNTNTHGGWKFIRNDNIKTNEFKQGVDQLKYVVDTLKTNPSDRRMFVSAWNPVVLHRMALPPCHLAWHVTVMNNKINLSWIQRSVDSMAGLPFNIASYALLLHLLSKESGFEPGRLCGFLSDTHIYLNHLEQVKLQLTREPKSLCKIQTSEFTSIFDWKWEDSEIIGYDHHPGIKLPIAI